MEFGHKNRHIETECLGMRLHTYVGQLYFDKVAQDNSMEK